MRPSWIKFHVPFEVIEFGVKWHVYEPELFSFNQLWIDGPYCPKCDAELEEKIKGIVLKKNLWTCNICNRVYEKPKCDIRTQVEKTFSKKDESR